MTSEKPKYSIIMAVHDQSEILERNLPKFLTQQGDIPYEVIVVDDSSTDETPDVLKRIRSECPHLYSTFLPFSEVPVPSRLRLALSVGVKASHGQWVLFADINRPPLDDDWLQLLSSHIDQRSDVSLAYNNKTKTIQSFDSLEEAEPFIRKAERNSGRGHNGRILPYLRGLYSVMMVRTQHAFNAIKLFDQPVKGGELVGMRLNVMFNNLF